MVSKPILIVAKAFWHRWAMHFKGECFVLEGVYCHGEKTCEQCEKNNKI